MVKSSLRVAFAAARRHAETRSRAEALGCRTHQRLAARTPRIKSYPIPRWTLWRVSFGTGEPKCSFDGKGKAASAACVIGDGKYLPAH